jgi:hypothetical protein
MSYTRAGSVNAQPSYYLEDSEGCSVRVRHQSENREADWPHDSAERAGRGLAG